MMLDVHKQILAKDSYRNAQMTQPWLSVYDDYATPFCLFENNKSFENLLYSTAVSFYFPKDKLDKNRDDLLFRLSPHAFLPTCNHCGICDYDIVSSLGEGIRDETFIGYLIEKLSCGYNLRTFFNYFHVPGTSPHGLKYYKHLATVVGFDAVEDSFILIGWFGKEFKELQVSSCALRKAFTSLQEDDVRVELIREKRSAKLFELNVRSISKQLEAFIEGADPELSMIEAGDNKGYIGSLKFTRSISSYTVDSSNVVWGMQAYDFIDAYLRQRCENEEKIDLRMTRLLFEHKTLMHRRLSTLCRDFACYQLEEVLKRYQEVVDACNAIRYASFAYMADRNEKGALLSELDKFGSVIKRERACLDITFKLTSRL